MRSHAVARLDALVVLVHVPDADGLVPRPREEEPLRGIWNPSAIRGQRASAEAESCTERGAERSKKEHAELTRGGAAHVVDGEHADVVVVPVEQLDELEGAGVPHAHGGVVAAGEEVSAGAHQRADRLLREGGHGGEATAARRGETDQRREEEEGEARGSSRAAVRAEGRGRREGGLAGEQGPRPAQSLDEEMVMRRQCRYFGQGLGRARGSAARLVALEHAQALERIDIPGSDSLVVRAGEDAPASDSEGPNRTCAWGASQEGAQLGAPSFKRKEAGALGRSGAEAASRGRGNPHPCAHSKRQGSGRLSCPKRPPCCRSCR